MRYTPHCKCAGCNETVETVYCTANQAVSPTMWHYSCNTTWEFKPTFSVRHFLKSRAHGILSALRYEAPCFNKLIAYYHTAKLMALLPFTALFVFVFYAINFSFRMVSLAGKSNMNMEKGIIRKRLCFRACQNARAQPALARPSAPPRPRTAFAIKSTRPVQGLQMKSPVEGVGATENITTSRHLTHFLRRKAGGLERLSIMG